MASLFSVHLLSARLMPSLLPPYRPFSEICFCVCVCVCVFKAFFQGTSNFLFAQFSSLLLIFTLSQCFLDFFSSLTHVENENICIVRLDRQARLLETR